MHVSHIRMGQQKQEYIEIEIEIEDELRLNSQLNSQNKTLARGNTSTHILTQTSNK